MTVDASTPDSAVVSESPLGLLDATSTDAHAVSESSAAEALAVAADSAAVSESATAEIPPGTDTDSAVLSEIEALLAEISATDAFTVTDTWNAPPVAVTEAERRSAIYDGWKIVEVPDEDEVLALAGYVGWYH